MRQRRRLGLHWGVKASFMDYIAAMPDSQASAVDGATATDGNVIVFEPASPSPPRPEDADLLLAFRGHVRFSGHSGLLFVRITDPWITVRGGEAVLTILDPHMPKEKPRLPLARLTLEQRAAPDDIRIWISKDVHLMEEGMALFNEVYPAGEQMEPLAVFLPGSTQD